MLETASSADTYKAVGLASKLTNNRLFKHLLDTMLLIPSVLTLNLYQD